MALEKHKTYIGVVEDNNDPKKQGKRLYGTNLMVQSPSVLREVKNPIVILKAGVYNEEIKADILLNINSSVVFFE